MKSPSFLIACNTEIIDALTFFAEGKSSPNDSKNLPLAGGPVILRHPVYSHNFEFLLCLLVLGSSQLSRFFFPQLFRTISNVTFVNLWKSKNLFFNIFIKLLRTE